jgi:hypothetical protein
MTVTRSFASPHMASADAAAPPHAFPMWPYAFMAYAEHCSRDYSDYVGRLAKAPDATAVIQAEEALGLNLLTDMNQAFFALVWAPFEAAAAVAGDPPVPRL